MLPGEHEGNETTEGGTNGEGVCGIGGGVINRIDKRLELFGDEVHVRGAAFAGYVLERAVGGVVDADNDEWLDGAAPDEAVAGFINIPLSAEGAGGGIECVLTVVHVEDGIFCVAGGIVIGGKPDGDIAVADAFAFHGGMVLDGAGDVMLHNGVLGAGCKGIDGVGDGGIVRETG